MTGTIHFSNEQSDISISSERLERLAAFVLSAERVDGDPEVSLVAVDCATMAEFNERFRGVSGPTDVLAFNIDDVDVDDPPNGQPDGQPDGQKDGQMDGQLDGVPVLLGDVLFCPEVAAANAAGNGNEFGAECDLLTVHGVLHLLGYDHADEFDARRMEDREQALLAEFGSAPLGPAGKS